LIRLLGDLDLAEPMGQVASAFARAKLDKEVILGQVEAIYREAARK